MADWDTSCSKRFIFRSRHYYISWRHVFLKVGPKRKERLWGTVLNIMGSDDGCYFVFSIGGCPVLYEGLLILPREKQKIVFIANIIL